MNENQGEEPKKRNRLPGRYPDRWRLAVAEEDTKRAKQLADHWRTSVASAIRRAVAQTCKQEGLE